VAVNVDGMSVALPDDLLNLLRGSVGTSAGAKAETGHRRAALVAENPESKIGVRT